MSCSRFRRVFLVAGVVLTASCWLPRPPEPPSSGSSQALDYYRRALLVEASTRLETPVRLIFDWSVREPGLRSGGRGVARLEPPYRARLDLFTGRGETVLRAALVGDDLRLPEGASGELVPPPALFWSSLGIFRPGGDYRLAQGWEADDANAAIASGFHRLEHRIGVGRSQYGGIRAGVVAPADGPAAAFQPTGMTLRHADRLERP